MTSLPGAALANNRLCIKQSKMSYLKHLLCAWKVQLCSLLETLRNFYCKLDVNFYKINSKYAALHTILWMELIAFQMSPLMSWLQYAKEHYYNTRFVKAISIYLDREYLLIQASRHLNFLAQRLGNRACQSQMRVLQYL